MGRGGGEASPPIGREKEEKKGKERERERESQRGGGGGERAIFCAAMQVISNNYLKTLS